MADLTDKTSSDSVASNDINTLLKGIPFYNALRTYDINEYIAHSGSIYKSLANSNTGNTPGSSPTKWEVFSGGGSKPDFTADFPAGSWDYPSTNPAPLDTDTSFTNGQIKRHLFDDTTEEFVEAVFQIPSDIDTSASVTFETYGYSVTAAASKNIELKFYHSPVSNGEDIDASYSFIVSTDKSVSGTQDYVDRITWSGLVSTLGWTANEQVRIKLSRIAPSVNNLSGDYGITHFRITIPRS
jgi:hypothetical protein